MCGLLRLTAHARSTAAMRKWKLISYGCVVVIALKFFTTFMIGEHEHHEMKTDYEYTHIRHKPFPWGDGETSLFEKKHSHH